jgi:hypothetical protein
VDKSREERNSDGAEMRERLPDPAPDRSRSPRDGEDASEDRPRDDPILNGFLALDGLGRVGEHLGALYFTMRSFVPPPRPSMTYVVKRGTSRPADSNQSRERRRAGSAAASRARAAKRFESPRAVSTR